MDTIFVQVVALAHIYFTTGKPVYMYVTGPIKPVVEREFPVW